MKKLHAFKVVYIALFKDTIGQYNVVSQIFE